MPPELMHTSMAGMLKYIFQSMQFYIGATKLRDEIDKMHVRMLLGVKRQSDRDFPRDSMRNGIIDDTKCQAEERKGNLFLLLCIDRVISNGSFFRHTSSSKPMIANVHQVEHPYMVGDLEQSRSSVKPEDQHRHE